MTPELRERMRRIRVLLDSHDDYLPAVRVTDLGDAPGPAESKRVPCPDCKAVGRVRTRTGSRYCPACDGYGWRKRVKGEVAWDEYVRAPIAEVRTGIGGALSVGEDIRRLSASIDRIQAVLDAKEGNTDGERFAWERARERYWAAGSYAELDRALAVMKRERPSLHRAVVALDDTAHCRLGLAWLAYAMPGPIRVPPWLEFQRSVKQAPTVAELHAEGKTAGQIARVLRMSKRKVQALLRHRVPSGP